MLGWPTLGRCAKEQSELDAFSLEVYSTVPDYRDRLHITSSTPTPKHNVLFACDGERLGRLQYVYLHIGPVDL